MQKTAYGAATSIDGEIALMRRRDDGGGLALLDWARQGQGVFADAFISFTRSQAKGDAVGAVFANKKDNFYLRR